MVGALVFDGGVGTTPVADEFAGVLPPPFVAVTTTTIVWPMSVSVSV
jgi:hypothetical protein